MMLPTQLLLTLALTAAASRAVPPAGSLGPPAGLPGGEASPATGGAPVTRAANGCTTSGVVPDEGW